MRRLVLATALVGSLIAISCTDNRQEGPTEPSSPAAAAKPCTGNLDNIQTQICALFPPTDLLKSASDYYNNIKTKLTRDPATAASRAADLVNFTFKQYYAGKLLDPTGNPDPTTAEAAVKLSCDVYALFSPPGTPCLISSGDLSTPLDEHSTLQACGPAGCLALPPDKHSGVSVPKDALHGPAFIRITPIQATFPRTGPLNTPKDQYLLFRLFELLGFDQFDKNVLVGICHLDVNDGDFAPPTAAVDGRLKLAHNITVGGEFETIEEFDRVVAPFLDCSDFNSSDDEVPPVITLGWSIRGSLASLGGTLLRKAVTPVFDALLPEPAEAATMGGCCLGGLPTRLTPWGAVDSLSGQEVRFFSSPDFGNVAFDPGGKFFDTGEILSWQYSKDGSSLNNATAYPAVQIIDPSGGPPRSGINVTVSLIQPVGGTATLSGTLTRATSSVNPAAGPNTAVFDNLIINQAGTYQLRFTAQDLPGVPFVDSGTFSVQDPIN